ncbi:hypothetical protein RMI40_31735 [Pseudomonas protegens]|uniref:hypothetical protein n=1 Tax=Pseudomonas protegens TaxID=380021 RepID=UPI00287E8D7E|nr:hypothetical protein [Pseudomonas protegens]MDS9879411.1 hypothetical protein [Pseudomonas protegens]
MPTETRHLEQRVAALQSDLNERDQRTDDQQFQLKDREGSRRDWFEEAQRPQAELDKRPSQIAMSLQTKIKRLEARLAERDALLRDTKAMLASELSYELFEKMAAHIKRIDAALSASAEPSEECNLTKATAFVERLVYCAGAQQSVATGYLRDILDVLKGRAAPSAPVERDERAEFERAWEMIPILTKGKRQIAEEFWQARAALDKATEGASHE